MSLPSRARIDHLRLQRLPAVGPGIEHVHGPEPPSMGRSDEGGMKQEEEEEDKGSSSLLVLYGWFFHVRTMG